MWASHLAYRGAGRTRSVEGCGWSSLFVRIDGEREEGEDRVGIVAMERVGKERRQKEGGKHVGRGGGLRGRGAADLPPVLSICMLMTRKLYFIGVRMEKGREERIVSGL